MNNSNNKAQLWNEVCLELQKEIASHQYYTWIKPLVICDIQNTDQNYQIFFQSPNHFSIEWVRNHYVPIMQERLAHKLGKECVLMFEVMQDAVLDDAAVVMWQPVKSSETEDAVAVETKKSPKPARLKSQQRYEKIQDVAITMPPVVNMQPAFYGAGFGESSNNNIDARYMFGNFVVGSSNQFAHASASAVAEHPGKHYNPLFLYSPPGLGKTHLLHAIGNHIAALRKDARVIYLSAEKFVNELIESLQHRKMSAFREKYRNSYDVILIDDIQFIAGKHTSEEEFFHTFNALYSSKRQIVVTSDRPPRDIVGLEQRVRTRFEWGLIADITPPAIETRIAILKTKAEQDDIYLPDEVATFLATYVKSNVRELEGMLIKLQAQASLTGSEISVEMAKQELKNFVPTYNRQYTIEAIQSAVAKHYRIKTSDLKTPTRVRAVAMPRQIAMFLVRKYTGLGFKEIGRHFGGKDHTTILHAYQKIEKTLFFDEEIKKAVESVQNTL